MNYKDRLDAMIESTIEDYKDEFSDPEDWVDEAAYTGKPLDPAKLEQLKDHPQAAYRYAKYIMKKRWPEAEYMIKRYPYLAWLYAKDVIKGRFLEAEPYINVSMWRKDYEDYFNIELSL